MIDPKTVLELVHPNTQIDQYRVIPAEKSSHDVFFLEYELSGKKNKIVVKAVPKIKYPTKNYDVQSEYKLLCAISDQNLGFKVPRPIAYSGKQANGASFFVMEMLSGPTYNDLIRQDGFHRHARSLMQILGNIHATPLQSVPFVESPNSTGLYISDLIEKLHPYILQNIGFGEIDRLEATLSFLRCRAPQVEQRGLLNGDFGAGQVIICNGADYAIDWDPAFIGDRSWDLWWMAKGGFARGISGNPEQFNEYLGTYEEQSKVKLLNSNFFKFAAQAYAYYLGQYIQSHDPCHAAAKRIGEAQLGLKDSLDKQLKD